MLDVCDHGLASGGSKIGRRRLRRCLNSAVVEAWSLAGYRPLQAAESLRHTVVISFGGDTSYIKRGVFRRESGGSAAGGK